MIQPNTEASAGQGVELAATSSEVHLRDIRTVVVVETWLAYVVHDGSLHVIGRNENEKTPRVSSALIHFDNASLAGWTQDRRYQLFGPPGPDADALMIWPNYCRYHDIDPDACRDVSAVLWLQHLQLRAQGK